MSTSNAARRVATDVAAALRWLVRSRRSTRRLVVACAIAASVPRVAVAEAADDLAALCTWTDARAERRMVLRFHDSAVPFASVHGGSGDRLDAVLGRDGFDALRFRVRVRSPRVSVGGDVDPMVDWLFRLSGDPVAAGDHATLTTSASVRVVESAGNGVRVRPLRSAEERVRVPSAEAVVRCKQLSVHRGAHVDDAKRLRDAGLRDDLGITRIRARGAPLRHQPRGRVIGRVARAEHMLSAYVVAEADGFAQVAIVHWSGPVWVGWASQRHLEPPELGEGVGGLLGALGALGAGTAVDVRRCDTDLPLRARAGRHDQEVGTVHAGAAFVLGDPDGAWTRVTRLPGSGVEPVDDATLWVPTAAATCAPGTWTAPGLSDLLP